jgi:uncharacterized protein DUF5682
MTEADALAVVGKSLNEAAKGLFVAPIRHHSPACAWAVRAMIREVRPKHVLVEAPIDFASHVDLITHPDTRPPVAIAALVEDRGEQRVSAYYPFCVHAPEYVALVEARSVGATVRLIDLPAASTVKRRTKSADAPLGLTDEHVFGSGDYVAALCKRTGCRDGFELWDHLFETRLGVADWRGFLADVGAYCAALRASTAPAQIERDGDAAREAHMGACVLEALADGGNVVVIVGGFHAPALLDIVRSGASRKPAADDGEARSFLIRYGFASLDALSGYAAGLPQPAYYDFLWRRANDSASEPVWRRTGLDLVSAFAGAMREAGHPINVPEQVEMLRAAETLALLRGRPGPMRHDLIDAARTALVKGELAAHDAWTERLIGFLRGNALGDVPASAGSPPLVEDARAAARRHRIELGDGARRRRRLDIRRNKKHLAASRYFHAMTMLETSFAELEVGPDFINNVRTELLFEEWSYAWSPRVEGRLIELAAQADRVAPACLHALEARREQLRASGQSRDIAAMTTLFARGLLSGLGADLAPFLRALCDDVQTHADFSAVAATLRRLFYVARSRGPLGANDLDVDEATRVAYARLVYLCDDLSRTAAEAIGTRIEALRLTTELLREDEGAVLDQALFSEAVDRVVESEAPAEILGAALAVGVLGGRRDAGQLRAALAGQFAGAVTREEDRVAMLRGVLGAAPQLLLQSAEVVEAVDTFLVGLEESTFIEVLPHVRLAFTALNPREVDQLAERLASLHGASAGTFATIHHSLDERDLARGLSIEQRLRSSIEADGLGAWLASEAGA